jgi:hypothetical protein
MRTRLLCRHGRSFADQRLAKFVVGRGHARELRHCRRAVFLGECLAFPEQLGEARAAEIGAARLERVQRLGQSRRLSPAYRRLDGLEQGTRVLEVKIDERT